MYYRIYIFSRNIPEGTGWILDGFPSNYNQAKTLEKALTGFGAADATKGKTKKSNLVPDPRPAPPPPDPASGIDVVINFEISDELCLKRAAGRYRKFFYVEELLIGRDGAYWNP